MATETNHSDQNPEIPDWLKIIQLNSWEAELLISALLLYMLFQVPGSLETYQKQHFNPGVIYVIFTVFITALKVWRIGYMLHIIARGIWVASVGLSYVYPKSLDLNNLKLKGKFAEEIRDDVSLEKTIKRLEKFASLSYAISFMISGMVISIGLVIVYLIGFGQWVLWPAMQEGGAWGKLFSLVSIFVIGGLILIVFIDFITNGVLRRDKTTAKYYYYIALTVRYMTLSFIYNRILLTITSNLPKWQRNLVPALAAALIVGYAYAEDKVEDWQELKYLEELGEGMQRANFESMRKKQDPLFATIPDEVIEKPVMELFLNTHGLLGRLYQKEDDRETNWSDIKKSDQLPYVNKYFSFTIDNQAIKPDWRYGQHKTEFKHGFRSFIDITQLESGLHTLTVTLDTARMNPLQKRVVEENDPYFVEMARIDFYNIK